MVQVCPTVAVCTRSWVKPGEPVGRHHIQDSACGKYGAVRAVPIPGRRIKNHALLQLDHGPDASVSVSRGNHKRTSIRVKKLSAQILGKVSVVKLGHGNSDKAIENVALEHAIPVPEEEELVFFDGPAEVAAIIVQDLLGFLDRKSVV